MYINVSVILLWFPLVPPRDVGGLKVMVFYFHTLHNAAVAQSTRSERMITGVIRDAGMHWTDRSRVYKRHGDRCTETNTQYRMPARRISRVENTEFCRLHTNYLIFCSTHNIKRFGRETKNVLLFYKKLFQHAESRYFVPRWFDILDDSNEILSTLDACTYAEQRDIDQSHGFSRVSQFILILFRREFHAVTIYCIVHIWTIYS